MAAASLAAGPSSCTDVASRTTGPAAWRHEYCGESSRLQRAAAAIVHQLGNEEVKAQTRWRQGLRRREERGGGGGGGRRGRGGGRGREGGKAARRSKDGVDGKADDARGDGEAKRVGRGRKPKVLKWICQQAGCKNAAQYGQNRSATPLACKQHRESWHERSKRYEKWTCKKSTCERHASYGRITAKGQRHYMFCG